MSEERLPPEIVAAIDEWVRRAGARGGAAERMREDLEQHFRDGLDAGRLPGELLAAFGDPSTGAARFADVPPPADAILKPSGRGMASTLDALRADLAYGVRTIRAHPVFALAIAAVLALGIAANAVTFTLVNEVLLEPLPVEDQASLVNVLADVPGGNSFTGFSIPDFRDLRAENGSLTDLVATSAARVPFGTPPTEERVVVSIVSPDYFRSLGVGAARGTVAFPPFTGWGADPVVVVSHGFWQRRLAGDPAVIGSTLRVDDAEVTVLGVAEEGFTGTFIGFPVELWTPLSMVGSYRSDFDPDDRARKFLELLGRRRPGVTNGRAQADLNAIAAGLEQRHPDTNRGHRVRVSSLTGIDDSLRVGVFAFTAVLVAVSLLVLTVTCLNVGGLLLVRAMSREREIAVRLAIGAGARRLLAQMLAETGLLALGATALALGVTVWVTAVLRDWVGSVAPGIGLDLDVDGRVLALTLAVAVTAALMASLVPSLHVVRRDPAAALRERGPAAAGSARVRAALVVGQVALSVLLAVSSGLLARALGEGLRVDPGFDADGVATFAVRFDPERYDPGEARALERRLVADLGALPGVSDVALAGGSPVSVARTPGRVSVPGVQPPPGEDTDLVDVRSVGSGYFAALGVELVAGEPFAPEDDAGPVLAAVVSRAFVERYFSGASPVGRTIDVDGAPVRVVGVAGDARYLVQDETPDPLVYLPLGADRSPTRTVIFRVDGDPLDLASPVHGAVTKILRQHPRVVLRTVRDVLSDYLLPQRVGAAVVGVMGSIAVVLSALGLYGLVQFTVSREKRSLGVRLALGGGRAHVIAAVLRRGALLVAIGVGVGGVCALLLTPGLRPFLAGVRTWDPTTYALVVVAFALVALAASLPPAVRASRIDPVVALRSD